MATVVQLRRVSSFLHRPMAELLDEARVNEKTLLGAVTLRRSDAGTSGAEREAHAGRHVPALRRQAGQEGITKIDPADVLLGYDGHSRSPTERAGG